MIGIHESGAHRAAMLMSASAARSKKILSGLTVMAVMLLVQIVHPALAEEYRLGPGDIISISVFKSPELSVNARVSEAGTIGFPLIGTVAVRGLTLPETEKKIAGTLKDGGFVLNPQVNVLLTLAEGNMVSVLGEVNKPGRYSTDGAGGHLTGMLALAGGIVSATGSDTVVVTGTRNGKPFRREIDVAKMAQTGTGADDIELAGGDTLYVGRAPQFYIYGQVQRPGGYRLDKGMTVMQAIAAGGGITGKGTTRGIVLHRRDANGKVKDSRAGLNEELHDQDVIDVKESMF
ncbi:MAG: polysaccharide export protein EpsE [Pseudomonadota bacterium]|nr:polysaccharide export protein EpsE [Pseudomonadota bacterium]